MIDCDIHNEIGDVEEFLSYVSPAQREWFRSHETALGLPGYTWSHPHSFYRDELQLGPGGEPASRIDLVQREVLDAYQVEAGLLTGDIGVVASLMPNPYRAAEFARAHNDWLADRWLDAEPRLRGSIIVPAPDPAAARPPTDWRAARGRAAGPRRRGSIIVPAQDRAAAAAEIERLAGDPRFAAVLLVGGSERPYGEPRSLPIFQTAADAGLPVAIHSG